MSFSLISFHCIVDEILLELNFCLFQLGYGKTGLLHISLLKVAGPIDNVN